MIGLKNCTPEEFEKIYVKYGISGSMDLNIPTFYFSLILEDNLIGYVKLTFKDENYFLEEIKYDAGMEKFNRFFLKCIAYKIFLKESTQIVPNWAKRSSSCPSSARSSSSQRPTSSCSCLGMQRRI